jgi:hypothetical protein
MKDLRPLTAAEIRLARIMVRLRWLFPLVKGCIYAFGLLIYVPSYLIERAWQKLER